MTNKNIQNITHFGLILMILICVYFFSQGYFTNPQLLQATLSKAGILAPPTFYFPTNHSSNYPHYSRWRIKCLGYYSLWSSQWIYI